MSSRNTNLTPEEREKAAVIFNSLREGKLSFKNGERNASRLVEVVRKSIEREPLAKIDYVAAVDSETLEPIENIEDRVVILATAVLFGKTRLIDNIRLNRKQ